MMLLCLAEALANKGFAGFIKMSRKKYFLSFVILL